jgi:hypothetical protein
MATLDLSRQGYNWYSMQAAFAKARQPASGKPLGNNNRIYHVENDRFGIGYRLEHYNTPIFTRYLAGTTSKSRLVDARIAGYEERGVAYLEVGGQTFVWPTVRYSYATMLACGGKLFRQVQTKPDPASFRWDLEYIQELPVEKSVAPRKLPKSRNTILRPKLGDAFSYKDEKYIWIRKPHTMSRGLSKVMIAIKYLGDAGNNRSYVHIPYTGIGKPLATLNDDNPLEVMLWASYASDCTAIERFEHDASQNERLKLCG